MRTDLTLALQSPAAAAPGDDPEGAGARRRAVCATCLSHLPVHGAAVTAMASDLAREEVFASDGTALELERRQYSTGAGPSLSAFTTGRPVLLPDAVAGLAQRWPMLAAEVAHLPLGAVFAFPLRVGGISCGVCCAYRTTAGGLAPVELAFVLNALDLLTVALVLLRTGTSPGHGSPGTDGGVGTRELLPDDPAALPRQQVHQATGMLMSQLGLDVASAFTRLRGHAFAAGLNIEQAADDVVHQRTRLRP